MPIKAHLDALIPREYFEMLDDVVQYPAGQTGQIRGFEPNAYFIKFSARMKRKD